MNTEVKKQLGQEIVLDCATVYISEIDASTVNIYIDAPYNTGILMAKKESKENIEGLLNELSEHQSISNSYLTEKGFSFEIDNLQQLEDSITKKQSTLQAHLYKAGIESRLADVSLQKSFSQEMLKKLMDNGFIDETYHLTTKGKRIVKLQEYGFNNKLHPLAYIHTSAEELYDKGEAITFALINSMTKFYCSADGTLYEIGGAHIPDSISSKATEDNLIKSEIQDIVQSDRVIPYTPFAYCPLFGFNDENTGYLSNNKLGVIVFKSKEQEANIFIDSLVLQYLYNSYGEDITFGESPNNPKYLVVFNKEGIVAIVEQENVSSSWVKANKFNNYDSKEILQLIINGKNLVKQK